MSEYILGNGSQRKLLGAHWDFQIIIQKAIKITPIDFTVIESHRIKYIQDQYFKEGKSKVKYPKGKHNTIPSNAIDVVPYVNNAVSWNMAHCLVLAGVILTVANEMGIKIRWGGDWDMDGEPVTDQNFQDLVHYERVI